MFLRDVNEHLSRLGYLPLGQPQLDALQRVLPAYSSWLEDCVARERASPHWASLRAAQFAVSEACSRALERVGVQVSFERAVGIVGAHADVRDALARVCRLSVTDPPDPADATLLRAAFVGEDAATRQQPARTIQAPDRAGWQVHKIHGARFAVAIEHTNDRAGRSALQIEAAERVPQSKVWDWAGKIIVQLKDPEVVEVLAVLQGRAARASFSHHGPNRDKSVELVAQPNTSNFMLAVRQGDVARAVPVPTSHAFVITRLALQVLQANSPGLSASDVLALAGSVPFVQGGRR